MRSVGRKEKKTYAHSTGVVLKSEYAEILQLLGGSERRENGRFLSVKPESRVELQLQRIERNVKTSGSEILSD